MSGEVRVPLGAPVQAYGEELQVLTFREPTGKDIRECGYPFRIHAETEEVVPQAPALARYISALAKIPMGSVDRLSATDFNVCMGVVMGFFGESPGASQGSAIPPQPDQPSRPSPEISPGSSAEAPPRS